MQLLALLFFLHFIDILIKSSRGAVAQCVTEYEGGLQFPLGNMYVYYEYSLLYS